MKKLSFTLLLSLSTLFCLAQSLPDFSNIKLEKKEDYNDAANKAVLTAANYLFSTPLDKNDINRPICIGYILRWAQGTPDYNFTFDEQATKFTKKSEDLLGLYLAAMSKYVLENKADAKDQNKIKLNALKMITTYVRDEKNKVKLNSELKKMIEAESKGALEEYIGIRRA